MDTRVGVVLGACHELRRGRRRNLRRLQGRCGRGQPPLQSQLSLSRRVLQLPAVTAETVRWVRIGVTRVGQHPGGPVGAARALQLSPSASEGGSRGTSPSVPETTCRPLLEYCGRPGPGGPGGATLRSAKFLSAACPGPGPWPSPWPHPPFSPQGVASTSSHLGLTSIPVPASAEALPCECWSPLASLVSVDYPSCISVIAPPFGPSILNATN